MTITDFLTNEKEKKNPFGLQVTFDLEHGMYVS